MRRAEVIAYHGWGFDDTFWQPLRLQLPEETKWLNFNRGYFGNSQSPAFSHQNGQKIVMTHSFGLHLCSDNILQQADILIIISGFLNFHPNEEPSKTRFRRILQKMIDQLDEHPQEVLSQFYQKVFHPQKMTENLPETINLFLLLDDLRSLNSSKRSLKMLQRPDKICILHGTEDAVVSVAKSRSMKKYFDNGAHLFEFKSAGHALPITHSKWCCNIIKRFVNS